MTEEEPKFDINVAAVAITNEYANQRMKALIFRCEQMRLGTYVPDIETANIMIKAVNEWLSWFVGEEASKWHYKLRRTGNTYQVYQDIERDSKPIKKKKKRGGGDDDRDGPSYSDRPEGE